MTSADACMNCGPGSDWQKKVCSIDGNAWCCDKRSSHPLCACPGEFADYVYCPSSPSCGPSLFNFTENIEEIVANATIDANFTNDLCIYELATDKERVVNIFTNERLTVFDPEYTRQSCLTYDCNITLRLTPGNDYYAMVVYPWSDFEFKVALDHSGEKKL